MRRDLAQYARIATRNVVDRKRDQPEQRRVPHRLERALHDPVSVDLDGYHDAVRRCRVDLDRIGVRVRDQIPERGVDVRVRPSASGIGLARRPQLLQFALEQARSFQIDVDDRGRRRVEHCAPDVLWGVTHRGQRQPRAVRAANEVPLVVPERRHHFDHVVYDCRAVVRRQIDAVCEIALATQADSSFFPG